MEESSRKRATTARNRAKFLCFFRWTPLTCRPLPRVPGPPFRGSSSGRRDALPVRLRCRTVPAMHSVPSESPIVWRKDAEDHPLDRIGRGRFPLRSRLALGPNPFAGTDTDTHAGASSSPGSQRGAGVRDARASAEARQRENNRSHRQPVRTRGAPSKAATSSRKSRWRSSQSCRWAAGTSSSPRSTSRPR